VENEVTWQSVCGEEEREEIAPWYKEAKPAGGAGSKWEGRCRKVVRLAAK
jgi:hypothetical protein